MKKMSQGGITLEQDMVAELLLFAVAVVVCSGARSECLAEIQSSLNAHRMSHDPN